MNTTIQLSKELVGYIAERGMKGETYEEILKRLLGIGDRGGIVKGGGKRGIQRTVRTFKKEEQMH